MARPVGPLERLGARVASALDEDAAARAHALETARRGFLEHEPSRPSASVWFSVPRFRWLLAAAGALVAVAALVLTRHRAAIAFEVNNTAGVARTWLAAPQGAALDLAFSEGTRVRLEATARARVTDIDEHGASLTLESGRLHAEVVHQPDSAWKVMAGPFTVRVTGTVFDVNWDATSQQLAVAVERGSVSVRDASTGLEQVVRASEALRASGYEHRLVVAPSSESPAEPASTEHAAAMDASDGQPADPAAVEARDPVTPPTAKNSDSSPEKGSSAGDEWRALAKRGALREAFTAADAAGFTQTCAAASSSELLLLGDGARLSGNSARAEEALLTLRRRFPNDARRAAAAFALGKVAFDQRRAYEQAAAWFSTCLREQPGGPLARETAGRLIEALRRADDSAGARRAARDYLEKYPEGPHADLARSVLR